MRSDDWQPVLVPQTLFYFSKVRPISIYWYHQLHVKIRVVKHIWREIGVGLWHIRVVDDVIKLLLKARVVLEVLRPVFRIWIRYVISQIFFLFEATNYLRVKLINNCLNLICLLF